MTSVVVVQVGQCGNQLGECLWEALSVCTNNGKEPSPFFSANGKARCVLVDSEPKVVQGVQQRQPDLFQSGASVSGQCGRGNNWGLGYHGVTSETSKRDPSRAKAKVFSVAKDQRLDDKAFIGKAIHAIHRELQRVEGGHTLEAILLIHSLAGGTGSGVTSRLAEKIRRYFTEQPTVKDEEEAEDEWEADGLGGVYGERRKAMYIVSIGVAPMVSGENALQGINTALTLHSLMASTDAMILLRNDEAFHPGPLAFLSPCQSFREANAAFVSYLLPVLKYGTGQRAIGELVETCAPDRRYKLLTLIGLPQKNLARFRRCAVLSREIRSAKTVEPMAKDIRDMHKTASADCFEVTHTSVCIPAPRVLAAPASSAGKRPLTFVAPAVVVLNQVEELNTWLLFPLLRDCALKCKAQAFLQEYVQAGVSIEFITAAYRQVAAQLLYEDT